MIELIETSGIQRRQGKAAVSASAASVARAKKSIAEIEDLVKRGMHTLMRTQAILEGITPSWCAVVPAIVLAVAPLPDAEVRSIDGHEYVEADEADERIKLIRNEGLLLLAGYQEIEDAQVRRAFFRLVRRLSQTV